MKKLNPMRPVLVLGILALTSLPLIARNAQAGPIEVSIEPETSAFSVGDLFDVDIRISGLDADDLGGFDFDLEFEPGVLQYQSYSLGIELTDPVFGQFDLSDDAQAGAGTLRLAEVSFLNNFSAQPDAFTLATVSFGAIKAGMSPLTISNIDLSDDSGLVALNVNSVNNGSVAVPTPGTLLLVPFGFGLLLMRRLGSRC